ncbi:MAG: hypothetical protein COV66_03845 [Nitrospinae bacterium CG11_big_fil_rev_8_21_14_0_20_45_15]|nr:MAG: hypothetical protein COV66_03845 [Nitrospinae bacterium CG11_big_fil_rev_8_21_14_0_20_45_15]
MEEKIKIGVSSCLLGEKVRWNGEHKQDRFVKDILGKYFQYISVCPEVEMGMGVPRETVALYGSLEKPRVIAESSGTDWTREMNRYVKARISTLNKDNLSGYIFKNKSPSCGLRKIPVHSDNQGGKVHQGSGIFANAFVKTFPLIPVEEEGRLNDPGIRENFIVRIFSFYRLKNTLLDHKANHGTLVKFHTQHKFLLLAHSRKHYTFLGNIVACGQRNSWQRALESYTSTFMEALTLKSTAKKNTDVLLHMIGFLKKLLPAEDKRNILEIIEDYRKELVPLIVPVTLIQHYVKKYDVEYLRDQMYLNPHPQELMLRNHV